MGKFRYPHVYPELSAEHRKELAKREVLIIDRHVAEEVLDPEDCMAVLEKAYREEGLGSAVNRTKANIFIPTDDPDLWYRYCTMEGGIRGLGVAGIRIKSDMVHSYTAFGKNRNDWYSCFPGRFFGLILLFSARDGALLAMLHDAHIQHMRVAATVSLATRHMARRDASVLGILGSGGMAWTHAYLLSRVRNFARIKIYSPNPEHRKAFATQLREFVSAETLACDDAREVVQGSDVVAACTNTETPVVFGEWLEPGMHIILTKARNELDEEGWRRLSRFVQYRSPPGAQGSPSEARWTAPADDRFAGGATPESIQREKKHLGDRIYNLPDVLLNRVAGRENDAEITCTANEGTGVQFAAVAAKVYQEAQARGLGRKIPLEWFLQDVAN